MLLSMVDIKEFINKVEEEFDDIQNGSLQPGSVIKDHFTWDSINALIFIAHVNVNYSVEITAQDLVESTTIQDLYNIVMQRAGASSTA